MNPYFNEVIDAHIAIERWLGKGAGEEQALLARFTPDFSMIALNGAPLDFTALCAFPRASRRQTRTGNRDRRDEAGGRMADGRGSQLSRKTAVAVAKRHAALLHGGV